ncbi:hypothetical protein [Paenibacillus hamazuiensis]|uniref:hypothetical protein n=1 Tax=Paenibacillus hamazuiensis TaxID=2936508 RepID=UPI00200FF700|nr:hypothetical protein [Paenibacillus hamazuiensis]
MNIGGIIRGVLGDVQASEPKTLELKVGQVVKGVVLQSLPEQEAIVNIGGVQVRARLETPLKQGDVTMLQVQPESGNGQVMLKPLQSSDVQISEDSLGSVLKELGLKDQPAARQLVQLLNQSGVPLTKENVQLFMQAQAQIPDQIRADEWNQAAVIAFQKGLPLTKETIQAVRQTLFGEPMHSTLDQLAAQVSDLLGQTEAPGMSGETKDVLQKLLQQLNAVRSASAQLTATGGEPQPAGPVQTAAASSSAEAGRGGGVVPSGGTVPAQGGTGVPSGPQAGVGQPSPGGAAPEAGAVPGAATPAVVASRGAATPAGAAGPAPAGTQASAVPASAGSAGEAAAQEAAGAGTAAPAARNAAAGSSAAPSAGAAGPVPGGAQASAVPASAGGTSQAAAPGAAEAGTAAPAARNAAPGSVPPGPPASAAQASPAGGQLAAGQEAAAAAGAAPQAGAPPAADSPTAEAPASPLTPAQPSGAALQAGKPSGQTPPLRGTTAPMNASEANGFGMPQKADTGVSGNAPAATNESSSPGADLAGKSGASAHPSGTGEAGRGASAPASSADRPVQPAPSENNGHWIVRMLKALGVDHEHRVHLMPDKGTADVLGRMTDLPNNVSLSVGDLSAGDLPDPAKAGETLKGLLMQLAAADDVPAAVKETAQQAVQQITGQQLMMSNDRTAMFSHVTMFVPLMSQNGEQTAAIHIQSRKGPRGELDANNCRLLFDLRMKEMGDTLVDVQVVDRIVSLHVHNNYPIVAGLLEANREEIASGMQSIGYQFISLKCSAYPEKLSDLQGGKSAGASADPGASAALRSLYSPKSYKGVDIRV